MALRIRKGEDSGRGGLVADRRLYRRADGTPCERGDRRAAFLVVGEGKKVPPEYVKRFDMRLEDGRVVWGPRKPETPRPDPKPEPTSDPKPDPKNEVRPESEEGQGGSENDPSEPKPVVELLPEEGEEEPKDEAPDPDPTGEPKELGGGWWELPDGRKVRTSELPDSRDGG